MKGLNVVLAIMGVLSVFIFLNRFFIQQYDVGILEKGFTLFIGGTLFGMVVCYIILYVLESTDNKDDIYRLTKENTRRL